MYKKLFIVNILLIIISCQNQNNLSNIENSYSILNNKKSIKTKSFFKNGRLSEVSFVCDSIIKLKNEKIICSSLYYSFYINGNLKEKGCQGIYNGFGVPVGIWFLYDKKNNLISTSYYHNDSYGKDFILVNNFVDGKIKKTTKYNNYILYENEKRILN